MFCTICGALLQEGEKVCPKCGAILEEENKVSDETNAAIQVTKAEADYNNIPLYQAVPAGQTPYAGANPGSQAGYAGSPDPAGQTAYAGANPAGQAAYAGVNSNGPAAYAGANPNRPAYSMPGSQPDANGYRMSGNANDMFVSPSEQQRAVIGSGFLRSLIDTGVFGKGSGVLTDRRFYFRGKSYYKVGGHYMKSNEELTVDIQDITASGFEYVRHLWLLILSICNFVFSVVALRIYMPFTFIFILIGIGFLAAYYLSRSVVYKVVFPGGNIALRASSYNLREIKMFDKILRQTKDEFLSQETVSK